MIKFTDNPKYMRKASVQIMIFLVCLTYFSCSNETDRNREVARLFFEEILNSKNTELIDEIIYPDIEFYRPDHKGDRFGTAAFRDYVRLNHIMSPDLKVVMNDTVAEGKKVAVRYNVSGTDKKSGNSYSSDGMAIMHIENGKITRIWENADDLNFLIQIGHIPALKYPYKHKTE